VSFQVTGTKNNPLHWVDGIIFSSAANVALTNIASIAWQKNRNRDMDNLTIVMSQTV
jgi:hypothetical protein